jgi:hypothetical protein
MIAATPTSSDRPADLEQQLLAVAISAGTIRAQLGDALSARERATLIARLERIETARRALEQQVIQLEHRRTPWWRRLHW